MYNLTLVDSYKDLLCFLKGEIYIKSQGNTYESNRTHTVTSKNAGLQCGTRGVWPRPYQSCGAVAYMTVFETHLATV